MKRYLQHFALLFLVTFCVYTPFFGFFNTWNQTQITIWSGTVFIGGVILMWLHTKNKI